MPGDLPHFELATRRALLRRGLTAASAVAAGAWLAACGNDDSSAFTTTPRATPTTTAAGAGSGTTSAANTFPRSPSTRPSPTTGGSSTSIAGDAVSVSFSYAASDTSGRVRNPYIAVWVEDDTSTMVGIVSVWYSTHDARYLRELTEFTAASTATDANAIDAVSGATRVAGQYTVTWDGTGFDGAPLTGNHTMWIEAAREHGPHSVTSGQVVLGQAGATTIPANGELSTATVTVA